MFKKLKENAEKMDLDGWNNEIQKYNKISLNGNCNNKFLSHDENKLCVANKIDPNYYLATKDFLIREFSIKVLSKENLRKIATDESSYQQMEIIYDYLQNNGMI